MVLRWEDERWYCAARDLTERRAAQRLADAYAVHLLASQREELARHLKEEPPIGDRRIGFVRDVEPVKGEAERPAAARYLARMRGGLPIRAGDVVVGAGAKITGCSVLGGSSSTPARS